MGYVAVVVDGYDRVIKFYTHKLDFPLLKDTPQLEKRWMLVTPNPESDCNILLA